MYDPELAHLGLSPGAGITRRRFFHLVSALGTIGCLQPQTVVRALSQDRRRLSWLAYRTAGSEGAWRLKEVEGKVPRDLAGTLYRMAPGQAENHGVTLRHFFDGDAYVSGFSFGDGEVSLRARFVATPERQEELAAGRMIYGEFGTLPPVPDDAPAAHRPRFKNQPSVNVIPWDGRLLGLSEGGHPTAIDPVDLSYQGPWDYRGTLPAFVPFTAHPKFDRKTGEGYGYGVAQGPGMALTVYRMATDGKLNELFKIPQMGYYMIHDMMLTQRHIVFVIPPVKIDLPTLFAGKETVADALDYFAQEPLRFLVLRRDGSGQPVTVNEAPHMVFHHGNAYERDGKLVLDSILSEGDHVLELLYSVAKDKLPRRPPSQAQKLTRLVIDPEAGTVVGRSELETDQEFPRFDDRRSGEDLRYLYTAEGGIAEDPLVSTRIVQHDLHRKTARRVEAGRGRAFGEAVFVPHPGQDREDSGWVLFQGYDAVRDENFLQIHDAGTFDFEARVWTGQQFPLGFHGNFAEALFVSV